ncbi:hypothetical protein ECANGB1_2620 [Enterospora canceri]|uniref:Uncharacterized protein n=1 Tax=Enterospora canceri TaxID=1081671 RepID=A0A1Y1SAB1_9MICR|nr:hypothetical protein ECANGB1_2620 [Enterospora canceri]
MFDLAFNVLMLSVYSSASVSNTLFNQDGCDDHSRNHLGLKYGEYPGIGDSGEKSSHESLCLKRPSIRGKREKTTGDEKETEESHHSPSKKNTKIAHEQSTQITETERRTVVMTTDKDGTDTKEGSSDKSKNESDKPTGSSGAWYSRALGAVDSLWSKFTGWARPDKSTETEEKGKEEEEDKPGLPQKETAKDAKEDTQNEDDKEDSSHDDGEKKKKTPDSSTESAESPDLIESTDSTEPTKPTEQPESSKRKIMPNPNTEETKPSSTAVLPRRSKRLFGKMKAKEPEKSNKPTENPRKNRKSKSSKTGGGLNSGTGKAQ